MSASLLGNRSLQERVVDMMLFLLSHGSTPTLRDWYEAVDDLFGEFSESQKQRVVEAGILMLERALRPMPMPRLEAA